MQSAAVKPRSRKPEQRDGFSDDDLANAVMDAFRFIRDDSHFHNMPERLRSRYLESAMQPFADQCGVECSDFRRYMSEVTINC